MINKIPKCNNLANYYKASSYVCSLSAPIVRSENPSKTIKRDIPYVPCTPNGFHKILPSTYVKVTSGISGKTQYRHAHTDLQIPDYTAVRRKISRDPTVKASENAARKKTFSYIITTMALTGGAIMAKEVATKIALYYHFNQDAYAMEFAEIEIGSVPEGKSVTFKWQGKPLFVKHRTAEEIEYARSVPLSDLRHPQTDSERVQKPEWLIMLGICTHLGCIPLPNKGDYPGGYFCPCHGSHYDCSGRARKGPAPENMELPPYQFIGDTLIRVG